MLELPDVTLLAVTTKNLDLTARAMRISMEKVKFGATAFFSPASVKLGDFNHSYCPPFSERADVSRFSVQELHKHIHTPFVLGIQWDGYVIDPSAWRPEFLEYDYIGAVWPWIQEENRKVGNGGFCLRSAKLLKALAELPIDFNNTFADDVFTCRDAREWLETAHDIKFAPDYVAQAFAYEREVPNQSTFGFHGLFNMWRHVEDSQMVKMADQFEDYVLPGQEYKQLMDSYIFMRKFAPLQALERRKKYGRAT